MQVDLNKLRTFYILAGTRNYTACAEKLYLTQSAVSHAIKELEAELGFDLVDRQNRQFRLTVEKHGPIPAQKRLLAMSSGDIRWANVRPPLTALPEAGGEVLAELLRNEIGEHHPEY